MSERRGQIRYARGQQRGTVPLPGFFEGRLVAGGPRVPMLIYLPCPIDPEFGFPMDRSRHLVGYCLGEIIDIDRIWTYAEMISSRRYHHLVATARRDPRKRVDLSTEPSIF